MSIADRAVPAGASRRAAASGATMETSDDGASVRCWARTWDDAAGGAKASAVDARWAAATRKETRRTIIIVGVGSVAYLGIK